VHSRRRPERRSGAAADAAAGRAGPKKMVGGKLVAMSVDVYISMEYGADGDLFNLRRAAAAARSPSQGPAGPPLALHCPASTAAQGRPLGELRRPARADARGRCRRQGPADGGGGAADGLAAAARPQVPAREQRVASRHKEQQRDADARARPPRRQGARARPAERALLGSRGATLPGPRGHASACAAAQRDGQCVSKS